MPTEGQTEVRREVLSVRGIVVPEREEDFSADPVELFFDLGYVLAFSQLVGHLVHHPDWAGVGKAALLFWLLWLPWQQFTWSANAVSGNGRMVRLLFLVGTATSIPMAASVSTAFDDGGPVFAVSLAIIQVLALGTLALVADEGAAIRRAILRWSSFTGVAIAVLVVGAFLEDGARIATWLLSTVLIVGGMADAGRGEWIIRTGHFAERHGLILIIALGEIIVAIGAPVVETLEEGGGLPASTVVALVGAGVFAGALWWAYFDRPGPALEHRAERIDGAGNERGRYARDVYTAAHAPLVAGIVLGAAGLEEIALHPDAPVPTAFLVMLAGGLALGVVGVAAAVWRAFGVLPRERIVAGIAIAGLLAVLHDMDGALLLVVVDAVIIVALLFENLRIERPSAVRATAPAQSPDGA
jgi:low temperature requirement protein LtrA